MDIGIFFRCEFSLTVIKMIRTLIGHRSTFLPWTPPVLWLPTETGKTSLCTFASLSRYPWCFPLLEVYYIYWWYSDVLAGVRRSPCPHFVTVDRKFVSMDRLCYLDQLFCFSFLKGGNIVAVFGGTPLKASWPSWTLKLFCAEFLLWHQYFHNNVSSQTLVTSMRLTSVYFPPSLCWVCTGLGSFSYYRLALDGWVGSSSNPWVSLFPLGQQLPTHEAIKFSDSEIHIFNETIPY